MRKLVLIALAFISIQAFAQGEKKERPNRGERGKQMMNLSPEEAATLQSKKMTLHLDLNEKQQAEVKAILLANAEARKAKMEERKAKKEKGELQKPTQEQRVKMANARLDHQIAMKAKMKKILNEEQYAKWGKAQARMAHRAKEKKGEMKKKMHQKKMQNNKTE
ncbi:hypothetical protein [Seonamhaeicola maritimus]|uniref:DUF4890 domain-containing protein n=1 Tax=Seonamhaeicola maritimus TaxID=2591822 RepID=A0A5C7GEC7_9FLAO|nr:hypothetical protein [Seonamhaeicola maritimus]TXG34731.1 hypothetical protein FUA22_17640 [Seonamhaeicola maritimus]